MVTLIVNCANQDITSIDDISRKAIDRVGFLGSLYDLRHDKFVSGSILQNTVLPDGLTSLIHTPATHYTFDHENSYSSTFKRLNVEGEFKVNILCNLVNIQGSGKYLSTINMNRQILRSTLVYRMETCRTTLHVSHHALSSYISNNAFKHPSATHIVTEIKWGANLFFTFEIHLENENERREIQGQLEAAVEKLDPLISASGKLRMGDVDNKKSFLERVHIEFSGDIILDKLPTTFDEARDVISRIPNFLKGINDGKGKQLEFILTPISEVVRQLNVPHSAIIDYQMRLLDEGLIRSIEYEFDEILYNSQSMNALVDNIKHYRDHLSPSVLSFINEHKLEFDCSIDQFRHNLANLVENFRSSSSSDDTTKNNMKNLLKDNRIQLVNYIETFLAQTLLLQNKIDLIKRLKIRNVECLKRGEQLIKLHIGHTYVLRINNVLLQDKNELEANVQQFINILESNRDAKFVMFDSDLTSDSETTTTITHYENGKLVLAADTKICSSVQVGLDSDGNDIVRVEGVSSVEACCDLCRKHPRCVVFTWIQSQQHCWLKHTLRIPLVTRLNSHTGIIERPVKCGPVQVDKDASGNDIAFIPNVESIADCCTHCRTYVGCAGVAWNKYLRECWLKNKLNQLYSIPDVYTVLMELI